MSKRKRVEERAIPNDPAIPNNSAIEAYEAITKEAIQESIIALTHKRGLEKSC
jgi:hypothetical protein